jgi:hypothetical protein
MRSIAPILLLVAVALQLALTYVDAVRLGSSSLQWEFTPSPAYPQRYLLQLDLSLPRSAALPANPAIGSTLQVGPSSLLVDATVQVSQTVNAGPCCGKPLSDTRTIQHIV